MVFSYDIIATDWLARAWIFHTAHGDFETPIFMPVGTKASVKWIHKEELDDMWAQIILNNTYHLYLRPGDEVVKKFWWVHKFMNYDKPILTDSWWFQVFSLGQSAGTGYKNKESLVKITDDWVHFRSYIDGSRHFFSPEKAMDIQSNLWADIIMAFDECAPGTSDHIYARQAMDRTHAWAIRSLEQVKKNNNNRKMEGLHEQALFPIIQWVIYDDLRLESARFISELDTPGIAIWWLSVWEAKPEMYRILDVISSALPNNKPRYLMWVGTPEDLVESMARGIDMWDCVLPTRLGRHGVAFGSHEEIKIKNNQYKLDDSVLDPFCECKVCKNYSKWYLRHLNVEWEMLGMQLLSYHNLYFLINLVKQARKSIIKHEFESFRKNFWEKRSKFSKQNFYM